MRTAFAVPDQQRKSSVTSDYSTGSGSSGDNASASFWKVRLRKTVNNGIWNALMCLGWGVINII